MLAHLDEGKTPPASRSA